MWNTEEAESRGDIVGIPKWMWGQYHPSQLFRQYHRFHQFQRFYRRMYIWIHRYIRLWLDNEPPRVRRQFRLGIDINRYMSNIMCTDISIQTLSLLNDSLAKSPDIVDVLNIKPCPFGEMRSILYIWRPPFRIGMIGSVTLLELSCFLFRDVR